MNFADVEVLSKVKLTKSLFRQIVVEDWTVLKGNKVLGWVNYFWQGMTGSKFGRFSYDALRGGELHVLWKRKDGQLRRSIIDKDCHDYDKISKMPQLFLGGSIFI